MMSEINYIFFCLEHDMSKEPFTDAKIKTIATALWTDDVKTAYKKYDFFLFLLFILCIIN